MDKGKSLLEQLAEMGFTDKQHNTSLLRQMRYAINHALSEYALRLICIKLTQRAQV